MKTEMQRSLMMYQLDQLLKNPDLVKVALSEGTVGSVSGFSMSCKAPEYTGPAPRNRHERRKLKKTGHI